MCNLLQSHFGQERIKVSITKDKLALLAERSEFFLPRYMKAFSRIKIFFYFVLWSLFVTSIQMHSIDSVKSFLITYFLEFSILTATVIPVAFLVDKQREELKSISIAMACVRVIIIAIIVGAFSIQCILMIASYLGLRQLSVDEFVMQVLVHTANVGGFTAVILIYYVHRYKEMCDLNLLFEKKLEIQNDHIKSRVAPHFLYNTFNALASLVESNSDKAIDMLQHISYFFRSSFNDPKESSFEDEIALCQHYLAIEKYRLQDKLIVTWRLPSKEVIYDMSITSLTLQNVLEKLILHVVERSTDAVNIKIVVNWHNHAVDIIVSTKVADSFLSLNNNLQQDINFLRQEERLQEHFGASSRISMMVNDNLVVTTIRYPLHDAIF